MIANEKTNIFFFSDFFWKDQENILHMLENRINLYKEQNE